MTLALPDLAPAAIRLRGIGDPCLFGWLMGELVGSAAGVNDAFRGKGDPRSVGAAGALSMVSGSGWALFRLLLRGLGHGMGGGGSGQVQRRVELQLALFPVPGASVVRLFQVEQAEHGVDEADDGEGVGLLQRLGGAFREQLAVPVEAYAGLLGILQVMGFLVELFESLDEGVQAGLGASFSEDLRVDAGQGVVVAVAGLGVGEFEYGGGDGLGFGGLFGEEFVEHWDSSVIFGFLGGVLHPGRREGTPVPPVGGM